MAQIWTPVYIQVAGEHAIELVSARIGFHTSHTIMKIEEQTKDSLVIVALSGRVDGFSAPELEERLMEITGRGDVRVLLDCEKMDYISSAGLRALLIGARKCSQGEGNLSLCALQPECESVMKISGFLSMFDIYEGRDAAIATESHVGGDTSC